MRPRRALAAAAVLALSVLVPVPGASSATPSVEASAQCELVGPARVPIFQANPVFAASISGTCAGDGMAAWRLGGTDNDVWAVQDPIEGAFITVSTGHLTRWGTQAWQPQGAWRSRAEHDADCAPRDGAAVPGPCRGRLSQNSPVSDVRLAAAAWLSVTRSRGVVTLTGTSLVYIPSRGFVKRAGAKGVMQYAEPGSSTWHGLASATTGSSASVRVQYRYDRTRVYRFALYSTPSSFDTVSTATTR